MIVRVLHKPHQALRTAMECGTNHPARSKYNLNSPVRNAVVSSEAGTTTLLLVLWNQPQDHNRLTASPGWNVALHPGCHLLQGIALVAAAAAASVAAADLPEVECAVVAAEAGAN